MSACIYCSQCENRHATENDAQGSVDERAMVTICRVLRGNYVSKMKRLETESNNDISACKITEQTFRWSMKGRNLAEREKNETISHDGCNGNYKINDETNIIRLRSHTPVKQRN